MRQAPQRYILRVVRVAAGAEVAAGLGRERAIEHLLGEPRAAPWQAVDPTRQRAIGP